MQEKDKINFIQQDLLHQKMNLKKLTERMNKEDVRVIKQIQWLRDINDRLFNHIFDIYKQMFMFSSLISFFGAVIFSIKAEMSTWWQFIFYAAISCLLFALWIYSFYQYAKCKKSKKQ